MKKFLLIFFCVSVFLLLVVGVGAAEFSYDNVITDRIINRPDLFFVGVGYTDQPSAGVFVHHRTDNPSHSGVVTKALSLSSLVNYYVNPNSTLYFYNLEVSYNGEIVDSIVYSSTTIVTLNLTYINGSCTLSYPVISTEPLSFDINYATWQNPETVYNGVSPVFVGNPNNEFIYQTLPFANLIPFPHFSNKNSSTIIDGVNIRYDYTSGIMFFNGTNTGTGNFTYRFYYNDVDPLLLPFSWYFSCPSLGVLTTPVNGAYFNFRFLQPDGSFLDVNGVRDSRAFTGGQYSRLVRMTLVMSSGVTISSPNSGLVFCISAGGVSRVPTNTNVPYFPYLLNEINRIAVDSAFDRGYNDGFRDGQNESYQDGYSSGLLAGLDRGEENLKSYFFQNATYILEYTFSGTTVSEYQVVPNSSINGFTINISEVLRDLFKDSPPENTSLDFVKLRVRFDENDMVLYDTIALYLGSTFGFDGVVFYDHIFQHNFLGSLSYNSNVGYRLSLDSLITKGLVLGGFDLDFGSFDYVTTDLIATVYSNDISYDAGYRDGYNQVVKDNAADLVEDAYGEGLLVGREEGYIEGLRAVEHGNFNSLIYSVIEAPFNVFSDLLNFDILGVNMLAFFGSLVTFAIFLFIIKKVIL